MADPVFPSLGSTMGGVATHSYVVSDAATPASGGSIGQPVTYHIAFPQVAGTAHLPGTTTLTDEVRTIFVTGFPDSVHERELHNLCRFIPGYEASQVVFKPNQQPQVFVLFSSAAHARQAMDALAGLPFDIQVPGSRGELAPGSQQSLAAAAAAAAATRQITSGDASAATSSSSVSNAAPLPPARLPTSSTGATAGVDERSTGSVGVDSSAGLVGPGTASVNSPTTQPVPGAAQPAAGASRLGSFVNNRATLLASGAAPPPLPSSSTLPGSAGSLLPATTPVKYHLRCEMAHKNLYIKEGDPTVRQPHRRIVLVNNPGAPAAPTALSGMNSSGAITHLAMNPMNGRAASGSGGTMYVQDPLVFAAGGAGGPSPAAMAPTVSMHPLAAGAAGLGGPMGGGLSHQPVSVGTPLGFLPVTNRGDNPPCNTLFIGNLSDQVSELELLHLLSVQPGYKQMKLVRGPRQVSCFVEFEDTASATAVHNSYQGAVLASSDRGGIRIQYSKNPFGKRSSVPGNNASAMLRGAVGLQGSGDLSGHVMAANAWPGVMPYHTAVQQAGQMPQSSNVSYY